MSRDKGALSYNHYTHVVKLQSFYKDDIMPSFYNLLLFLCINYPNAKSIIQKFAERYILYELKLTDD